MLSQRATDVCYSRFGLYVTYQLKNVSIMFSYKERPGLPEYNDEPATSVTVEKIHGPATDRLASLKQAFRSQYSQVRQ